MNQIHVKNSTAPFDFFFSKKLCATAISQLYYIHPSGNINKT
jgi:hypothetical protein